MANQVATIAETVIDQSPPDSWSILAGVAAFGSTLAVSTWAQGRLLGISTGSPRPVATVAGVAAVCAASLASHHACLATHDSIKYGRSHRNYMPLGGGNSMFRFREDHLDLKVVKIPLHPIRICVVGLLAFKLLGGRFRCIPPSSFTDLGSFARPSFSLPATDRYATSAQRAVVERMGRAVGCHTCGSRMRFHNSGSVKFVADHMPPKVVMEQLNRKWYRQLLGRRVSFRFYPQCVQCSSKQGSILSKATIQASFLVRRTSLSKAGGGARAYFHGLRPRVNHLAGGVVAATAVVGVGEADILDGNRWRYAKAHRRIDAWVQTRLRDVQRALVR